MRKILVFGDVGVRSGNDGRGSGSGGDGSVEENGDCVAASTDLARITCAWVGTSGGGDRWCGGATVTFVGVFGSRVSVSLTGTVTLAIFVGEIVRGDAWTREGTAGWVEIGITSISLDGGGTGLDRCAVDNVD